VPYLLPYRQNTIRLDPNELSDQRRDRRHRDGDGPAGRSAVKVTFAWLGARR
jgi:outer membrane usher protein FimD/PapC